MRIAIKIAYFGKNYSGSQIQPHCNTVEGEIVKTLKKLKYITNKKENRLQIASRTDKGVNALGNILVFDTNKIIRLGKLNDSLPKDIITWAKAEVPDEFMARHADSRAYEYIIPNEANLNKIRTAAKQLTGEHDFHNFSKKDKTPIDTKRVIKKIIIKKNTFYFEGQSFLWQQIRRMTKYLLQTGYAKKQPTPKQALSKTKYNLEPLNEGQLTLIFVKYKGLTFKEDQAVKKRLQKTLKQQEMQNFTQYLTAKQLFCRL